MSALAYLSSWEDMMIWMMMTMACSFDESGPESETIVLRTILLTAGPAWDLALPPEEQDLADHFAEVGERFEEGALLAYGPYLDDGRGLYLYSDEDAIGTDQLLAEDPAIQSGVLALDTAGDWTLLLENLGAATLDPLFVLDAAIAPNADLDAHFDYMGGLFEDGQLLAGGPVSDTQGRYIVAAADDTAAQAVVAADPGVSSGALEMTVRPWGALQRQGAQ